MLYSTAKSPQDGDDDDDDLMGNNAVPYTFYFQKQTCIVIN